MKTMKTCALQKNYDTVYTCIYINTFPPPPHLSIIIISPSQGNLRVCKECLEIFQEFQSVKRSDGASLNSDKRGSEPSSSSSAKLRSASNSLQKNLGEGTGGGMDTANLLRVGSGNYGRSPRQVSMLSPHKSWDDTSAGDDEQSVSGMSVGFDNPTPMHSVSHQREGFGSLRERDERLMALNEVRVRVGGGCGGLAPSKEGSVVGRDG